LDQRRHTATRGSGDQLGSFNLQRIAKIPGTLSLHAHFGATQVGSVFTLLLGGGHTAAGGGGTEYAMAFQPVASPTSLLWHQQIESVPASYLAAWNFAPSSETGIDCPIAIAVNTSGNSPIVRLRDF
jgi:hypothetical protein